MLKALPVLIILGLAIYSFFDVLRTPDLLIKSGHKAMWMILSLVPVIGAALWFLLGRPSSEVDAHPPARGMGLRRGATQVAPDDDPSFLRRLDDEAWIRKRDEARSREQSAKAGENSQTETSSEPNRAATEPTPSSDETTDQSSEDPADRKPQSEEQTPGEQDL